MSPKEKKRFEELAEKDKNRYQKEMANYTPPAGASGSSKGGKKRSKDPNAPKRALYVHKTSLAYKPLLSATECL